MFLDCCTTLIIWSDHNQVSLHVVYLLKKSIDHVSVVHLRLRVKRA